MTINTHKWFGLASVFIAALSFAFIYGAAGCSTSAPAGGGAPVANNIGLEDIQGEWLYLRIEDDELISGDCLTIENDQVAEFIDNCDGEDLLLSSSDITEAGGTFVLRFVVEVTIPDEPAESVEITATLTQDGDIFVGTEVTDPPLALGDQIVLRRPEE